jgi:hypothetical protein
MWQNKVDVGFIKMKNSKPRFNNNSSCIVCHRAQDNPCPLCIRDEEQYIDTNTPVFVDEKNLYSYIYQKRSRQQFEHDNPDQQIDMPPQRLLYTV